MHLKIKYNISDADVVLSRDNSEKAALLKECVTTASVRADVEQRRHVVRLADRRIR